LQIGCRQGTVLLTQLPHRLSRGRSRLGPSDNHTWVGCPWAQTGQEIARLKNGRAKTLICKRHHIRSCSEAKSVAGFTKTKKCQHELDGRTPYLLIFMSSVSLRRFALTSELCLVMLKCGFAQWPCGSRGPWAVQVSKYANLQLISLWKRRSDQKQYLRTNHNNKAENQALK
jgi:hypothetical protein